MHMCVRDAEDHGCLAVRWKKRQKKKKGSISLECLRIKIVNPQSRAANSDSFHY